MIHAIDSNNDGMISESELLHMMEEMGAEPSLTPSEIKVLFEELGEDVVNEKQIPTHCMEQLLLENID